MNILSKDILPLKTSQKFSSVLEPYAGKVASTVLRRECHCEVMFLSDYIDKKLQEARSQSQKDEIIEAIKNSSIVHWSHINFYGTYDFTKVDKKVISMIS